MQRRVGGRRKEGEGSKERWRGGWVHWAGGEAVQQGIVKTLSPSPLVADVAAGGHRRDIIMNKSKAAAGLCDWAINIVKYFDVVAEVEPKRLELAAANEKLARANATMAAVEAQVAALNAQVKQLEAQYAKVRISFDSEEFRGRNIKDTYREGVGR